jgi:hypothetical protein
MSGNRHPSHETCFYIAVDKDRDTCATYDESMSSLSTTLRTLEGAHPAG